MNWTLTIVDDFDTMEILPTECPTYTVALGKAKNDNDARAILLREIADTLHFSEVAPGQFEVKTLDGFTYTITCNNPQVLA